MFQILCTRGQGPVSEGSKPRRCDASLLASASVNVSGRGTPRHREVRGRPDRNGRTSGRKNRSRNSSTRSKARKGFPVRVGALMDRAMRGPIRAARQRGGQAESTDRRGQTSQTAKRREGVSRCFHVRSAEIGSRIPEPKCYRLRERPTGSLFIAPAGALNALTRRESSDLTTNSIRVTNRGRSQGSAGWYSPRCCDQRVLGIGSVAQVEVPRERERCFRRKSGRN